MSQKMEDSVKKGSCPAVPEKIKRNVLEFVFVSPEGVQIGFKYCNVCLNRDISRTFKSADILLCHANDEIFFEFQSSRNSNHFSWKFRIISKI